MYQQEQFLKSYMYISTNVQAIPDALMRGFSVVVLADVEDSGYYPGCVVMSNLLPPPPLVYEILNTDRSDPNYNQIINHYYQSYYMFLGDPGREESIVNILASLYKTTHPLLIFTEDSIQQQFGPLNVLVQFFHDCFGIVVSDYANINTMQQQPYFIPDPKFVYNILEELFINSYISKVEYAMKLPEGAVPSPRSVSILLSDYNTVFPNLKSALIAAVNIINMIRQEQVSGKQSPVVQFTKSIDQARQQEIENIVQNSNTTFGNPNKQLLPF